ncbi:MAG: bifunctional 3-demethylubiquinone 3-O-methyltransferase/2-octaprenyl-6-hydroxy phenol methylase, partial [Micromonosporaceae bacterium]
YGVDVRIRGIRPEARGFVRWLATRRGAVRMVPAFSAAILYQAYGRKAGNPRAGTVWDNTDPREAR